MLTRRSLVTPSRAERLDEILTAGEHVAGAVTWDFYQEIIAAYDEPVAGGQVADVQADQEDPSRGTQGVDGVGATGADLVA